MSCVALKGITNYEVGKVVVLFSIHWAPLIRTKKLWRVRNVFRGHVLLEIELGLMSSGIIALVIELSRVSRFLNSFI